MRDDPRLATLAVRRCVGCQGPTGGTFAVWDPTAEGLRDLGLAIHSPARIAYPLCRACAGRCTRDRAFADSIEDAVIRRHHSPVPC